MSPAIRLAPLLAIVSFGCDRGEATSPSPGPSPSEAPPPAPAAAPKPEAKPATPAAPAPAAAPAPVTPGARDEPLEAALATVTPAILRTHVEWLAADARSGRATPSPELDIAAGYIAGAFRAAGLAAPDGAPEHRQSFPCGDGEAPSSNVVGLKRGGDSALADEVVMVSAHYDHLGVDASGGQGGDAIFNGANDNASGTAAMLAIASALDRLAPKRSILFVAFCGEELGFRGSSHFVASPLVPLDRIVVDVNLEMLGRPTASQPPRVWVTGMELSTLGEVLAAANVGAGVEVVPSSSVGPVEGAAFNRSDNWPFARAGVVAHSISTGRVDEHYHQVTDEPEVLDYDAMAPLVRAVTRGVIALANASERPRWSAEGTAAGFGVP